MCWFQGELPNGRVAWFRKPRGPHKLWTEELLGEFHYPRALTSNLIGEDDGPRSKLLLNGQLEGWTNGIRTAFPYRNGFVLVGRDGVFLLPNRDHKGVRPWVSPDWTPNGR